MNSTAPCTILMAEDDQDDQLIIETAFEERAMESRIRFVPDGEALMEYLNNAGEYEDKNAFPEPSLILLDLNMPKKDGRTALAEIRKHPRFHDFPVLILTTSTARSDREYCAEQGVVDYLNKPTSLDELSGLVDSIAKACGCHGGSAGKRHGSPSQA